ncbi:MAG TPA: glycosyltransferase [Chthoniobacterales bacterium]
MSSNQEQPEISLVIPARDEAGRLPATLDACQRAMANWPFASELIVFAEPGGDDTAEIAESFAGVRVLRGDHPRGKGFAVRAGLRAARGAFAHFFMDADLSVPLDFVPIFVEEFQRDPAVDVLFGSRRHPQSKVIISQPWQRVASGRLFNWVMRGAGLTRFRDTQCGFKAFRAEWTEKIFSRATLDGFAFDVEILRIAQQLGAQVREMPVDWMEYGGSTVHMGNGVRAVLDALSLKSKK